MKYLNSFILIIALCACGDSISKKEYKTNDQKFKELFVAVETQHIFDNPKIFADAIPKDVDQQIVDSYNKQKTVKGFDLKKFVLQNFDVNLPKEFAKPQELKQYLNDFYVQNTFKPKDDRGSLIPTNKKYLGGGGYHNEFNYWTSYFDLLGIDKDSMKLNTVVNCVQFIQDFGYVIQNNRTYSISRSNPPVLSLMIEYMAETQHKPEYYTMFLTQITKEYQYWMAAENLDELKNQSDKLAYKKVVFLPQKNQLNRYYDGTLLPRTEHYIEDLNAFKHSKNNKIYSEIRTADESAWPENSRWTNTNLEATSILPVDLNAILYHLEKTLAKAYKLNNKDKYAESFENLAAKRKAIFDQYFWKDGYYYDFNFVTKKQNNVKTAAGLWPLFVGLASNEQAQMLIQTIKKDFLTEKGISLLANRQTYAAEYNWIAIQGLRKYKENELANTIKWNWIQANEKEYAKNKQIILPNANNRLDAAVSILKHLINEKP